MAKRTTKKPGLPRELRAAIQIESPGLWIGALTHEEISKQISRQAEKKLAAMMKHFNIPPHSPYKWKHLSFCLAKEFGLMVVTLKLPKKPHASRVWSEKEHLLIERMNKKIADRRQRGLSVSIRNIARYLKTDHPEYKHLTEKSIINRYGEATKRRSEPHPWSRALDPRIARLFGLPRMPEK